MQLDPGERSILAAFSSWPEAMKAREALVAAGMETVQVDRIGEGGFDPERTGSRPVFGDVTSQTATLYDAPAQQLAGNDARPLEAARTEASGMAGPITAEGHGVLLTAVVPAQRFEEAERLIARHGGRT